MDGMIGSRTCHADESGMPLRAQNAGGAFETEALRRNVVRAGREQQKSALRGHARGKAGELAIRFRARFEILSCSNERRRVGNNDVEGFSSLGPTLQLLEHVPANELCREPIGRSALLRAPACRG